jgi:hypothetical protein
MDLIGEIVETRASLARTSTVDEIETLVGDLGEDKVLEWTILIEEFGKSRLMEILQEESG